MRPEREIRRAKEIQVTDNALWIEGRLAKAGIIRMNKWSGTVVWGRDEGIWEHVSVSPLDGHIPTWDEMCRIKNIFWGPEETVIQFFPRESEYVNIVDNCMHLWAPKDTETRRRLEIS